MNHHLIPLLWCAPILPSLQFFIKQVHIVDDSRMHGTASRGLSAGDGNWVTTDWEYYRKDRTERVITTVSSKLHWSTIRDFVQPSENAQDILYSRYPSNSREERNPILVNTMGWFRAVLLEMPPTYPTMNSIWIFQCFPPGPNHQKRPVCQATRVAIRWSGAKQYYSNSTTEPWNM